jgi:hypothetical protein
VPGLKHSHRSSMGKSTGPAADAAKL